MHAEKAPALTPHLARYFEDSRLSGPTRAMRNLRRDLEKKPDAEWSACAAELQRQSGFEPAIALLQFKVSTSPGASELQLQLGELLDQSGAWDQSETTLRKLWQSQPTDFQTTRALATALRSLGRLVEAGSLMATAIDRRADEEAEDPGWMLDALAFISGCQQIPEALACCERRIAQGVHSPELYSLAGRMALSMGQFQQARQFFLDALAHGADSNREFILQALADTQKYADHRHPDFARFDHHLQNPDLALTARASVLFARGKAFHDIGNFEGAARDFTHGNAIAKSLFPWSQTAWQEFLDVQLSTPFGQPSPATDGGRTPVFIVGLPRSGSTLIAELLGRHPDVRNRGELNLVPYLHRWLGAGDGLHDQQLLLKARRFACAQLWQDDAPARWYLDKNPLNFRYLPLLSRILPESRVIFCRRDLRDTALSIWKTYFGRGEDNGYAYHFPHMRSLAAGCTRLIERARQQSSLPIYTLDYEALTATPAAVLDDVGNFIGLSKFDFLAGTERQSVISSASVWQARQPISRASVGSWRAYAPFVPELQAL